MEYYNSTVLAGSVGVAGGQGGAIQPDSAYKSLGSVYNGLDKTKDRAKMAGVTQQSGGYSLKTRGVINMGERSTEVTRVNMAERSYSVSEVNRAALGTSGLHRTPHRAGGYGGGGQPTRGPHR